jgi:nitrite reductase/ring-hydroxylating ferredoxin subunit
LTYRSVAALDALWPGEMLAVEVDSVKVLLINFEGTVHAFENRCAHQAALLSNGRLEGNVLTCSVHHWCYDVRSGCGINPSSARLRRFATKIEEQRILVDVSDDGIAHS